MIDTQAQCYTSDFWPHQRLQTESQLGVASVLNADFGSGQPFSGMLAAYSDEKRTENVQVSEKIEESKVSLPDDLENQVKKEEKTDEKPDFNEKTIVFDVPEPLIPQIVGLNSEQTVKDDVQTGVKDESAGKTDMVKRKKNDAVPEEKTAGGAQRGGEGNTALKQERAAESKKPAADTEKSVLSQSSGENAEESEENAVRLTGTLQDEVGMEEAPEAKTDSLNQFAAGHAAAEKVLSDARASGDGKKDEGEKKDNGSQGVLRSKTAKQEKAVKFEIHDLRAQTGSQTLTEERTRTAVDASGNEVEIVVEVKTLPQSSAADGAFKGGSAFMNADKNLDGLLSQQLRQYLNGDIVRNAQVMLRDNGEGTIKLALRPESLGNVKIRLEMSENKVVGKIIVESKEAMRAFRQEIHGLETAFLDAGFDGAALDMAFAGGGAEERREAREDFRTLTAGINAARYDEAVETASEGSVYSLLDAGNSVNVFV